MTRQPSADFCSTLSSFHVLSFPSPPPPLRPPIHTQLERERNWEWDERCPLREKDDILHTFRVDVPFFFFAALLIRVWTWRANLRKRPRETGRAGCVALIGERVLILKKEVEEDSYRIAIYTWRGYRPVAKNRANNCQRADVILHLSIPLFQCFGET